MKTQTIARTASESTADPLSNDPPLVEHQRSQDAFSPASPAAKGVQWRVAEGVALDELERNELSMEVYGY